MPLSPAVQALIDAATTYAARSDPAQTPTAVREHAETDLFDAIRAVEAEASPAPAPVRARIVKAELRYGVVRHTPYLLLKLDIPDCDPVTVFTGKSLDRLLEGIELEGTIQPVPGGVHGRDRRVFTISRRVDQKPEDQNAKPFSPEDSGPRLPRMMPPIQYDRKPSPSNRDAIQVKVAEALYEVRQAQYRSMRGRTSDLSVAIEELESAIALLDGGNGGAR